MRWKKGIAERLSLIGINRQTFGEPSCLCAFVAKKIVATKAPGHQDTLRIIVINQDYVYKL